MRLTATPQSLANDYLSVRRFTERLTSGLGPEDATVQSMPDASPVKWHMAHTTWFFETFVLSRVDGYQRFHPSFEALFNSYYNAVGTPFPRAQRGVLSRPTLEQVRAYRLQVDEAIVEAIERGRFETDPHANEIIRLGLQHEQQHQELILTDIKHAFSTNPLQPEVLPGLSLGGAAAPCDADWIEFPEGNYEVGHSGDNFAYDNESPRHRVWLDAYRLRNSPVSCGEYAQFIAEDGYQRSELWLSEGWSVGQSQGWRAPIYWRQTGQGEWTEFTLSGRHQVDPNRPMTHLSYFEADAFARWAGSRLPTEAEWEVAAAEQPIEGAFADVLLADGLTPHPAASVDDRGPAHRLYGDSWEWTSSSYSPYPGYQPPPGALGEYNGKFMCNQYVLRGGSCASSQNHLRATYRNFFSAACRWQFSGLRLAACAG